MADADPPHEIDDVESPRHRDVDPKESYADEDQAGEGIQQHHHEEKRDGEAQVPAPSRPLTLHDRADLVRDRAERVPGTDHGWGISRRWRLCVGVLVLHT